MATRLFFKKCNDRILKYSLSAEQEYKNIDIFKKIAVYLQIEREYLVVVVVLYIHKYFLKVLFRFILIFFVLM